MNQGATSTLNRPAPAKPVNVQYNVWNQPGNFAGQTVAQVRESLGKMMSIPNDAVAYNGADRLDDNSVLEPGMNIEFIRKSGEKGIQ